MSLIFMASGMEYKSVKKTYRKNVAMQGCKSLKRTVSFEKKNLRNEVAELHLRNANVGLRQKL